VNGFNNNFSAGTVTSGLNAIYNKVGIHWHVTMAENFSYPELENRPFNVTGSGLFSTETADMKAINQAYKDYLGSNYNANGIYLFIIEDATGTDEGNVLGDMPRNSQFGYLFRGADTRTIAHELGHGAFHLDHPFARANASKSFAKGALSDNLMEYGNGSTLVKYQWDAIHAPGLVIGLFEKDEDNLAVIENQAIAVVRILKSINCAIGRKDNSVKLYLPSSAITGKVDDVSRLLNNAGHNCGNARIRISVGNIGSNYIEDTFNTGDIVYNNDRSISLKGDKYTLLIHADKEIDNPCVYSFVKSIINGSITYKNPNFQTIDDLQYASLCEYEQIGTEQRGKLLRELAEGNGSLNRSKQIIVINLIKTVYDKNSLYTFFKDNLSVLNALYSKIDNYQEDFLVVITNLWLQSSDYNAESEMLQLAQSSLVHTNALVNVESSGYYKFSQSYLAGGDAHYSGFRYGSKDLATFHPFDPVDLYLSSNIIPVFIGPGDKYVKIPAIVARGILENKRSDEFWNYISLASIPLGIGQVGLGARLVAVNVRNVSAWMTLTLGVVDLATYPLEEYARYNPNTELAQLWLENRGLIYGGLIAGNVYAQYANNAKRIDDILQKEIGKSIGDDISIIVAKGGDAVGTYTTKIRWGIQDVDVRPYGKGYWGKRVPQTNPRVDAFELKINPNNESFYLPHPDGGYVQFENVVNATVQDGKLIMEQSSIYHVLDKPDFLVTSSVLEPAKRQIAAAKSVGYEIEWLVSDEKAVQQLTQYFKEKDVDIVVKLFKE
jgi:hypothetical protein